MEKVPALGPMDSYQKLLSRYALDGKAPLSKELIAEAKAGETIMADGRVLKYHSDSDCFTLSYKGKTFFFNGNGLADSSSISNIHSLQLAINKGASQSEVGELFIDAGGIEP